MTETGSRTVLGFDYGTRSIGVAIGQEITGSATPLKALRAVDGIPDWNEIQKLLDEWKPDLVVVGLPLNMDATTSAREHLFANGGYRALKKGSIDSFSAVLILENFFES